jgi:MerR family transcriptional regulator, light-induced transcriptional regulator
VAVYSIKDLEKLSGIKAHTIRIWEQRYGLIAPSRTKTNIRYYEDSELKFLLNIALLNKNGCKISKIAEMNRAEITAKVASISTLDFEYDTQIDALTLAMIDMDEYKFDRIIASNTRQKGFEKTIIEVVYPFLEKLSVLWLTGSVNAVQENFITNLIRQKIIAAIDSEPYATGRDAKKFIIYLPEGETQELSLLFLNYLLRSRRYQVVYLGTNMSLEDVEDACSIQKPDFVFTMINEPTAKVSIQEYADSLSQRLPLCSILLSGYQIIAQQIVAAKNMTILKSLQETIEFANKLKVKVNKVKA